MTAPVINYDDGDVQPVTPVGCLFLRPEMDMIVHCIIGVKHHLDVETIKSTVRDSLMVQLPMFRSLLVRDKSSREYWKATEVDVDRHIFAVHGHSGGGGIEELVNGYVAHLSVGSALGADKPLWEIHVMVEWRCVLLRMLEKSNNIWAFM